MFKAWFIAMRPWSFTAAFVPVAVGTALAWSQGFFQPGLFFLTSLGAVLMQAGTNFINTYGDYCSGVDTVESAHTCPQLVTGAMRPADMKRAGFLAFGVAVAIGLALSWLCGWEILVIGLVGVLGGYTYTAGPCPFKYRGLGSIFVFFLMGPLMVWPAASSAALITSSPAMVLIITPGRTDSTFTVCVALVLLPTLSVADAVTV